jgi:hypothetical protein
VVRIFNTSLSLGQCPLDTDELEIADEFKSLILPKPGYRGAGGKAIGLWHSSRFGIKREKPKPVKPPPVSGLGKAYNDMVSWTNLRKEFRHRLLQGCDVMGTGTKVSHGFWKTTARAYSGNLRERSPPLEIIRNRNKRINNVDRRYISKE